MFSHTQHRPARRGKRKTKGDLFIHTKNALRDRYHIDLTEDHYNELNKKVQSGQAELVIKQTNSRTIWKVPNPYNPSEFIYLVYNKNLSAVCTALTEYMVEQIIKELT